MKLSELSNDKIDIFLQRSSHVAELPVKLQWVGFYGTPERSELARRMIRKLYDQNFRSRSRPDPRKMGEILRVRNVWRDINESWFLQDLMPLIPRSWKTGVDREGAQILTTIGREQGPGDDSALQNALSMAVSKLAQHDYDSASDLVSKHILHELFA